LRVSLVSWSLCRRGDRQCRAHLDRLVARRSSGEPVHAQRR
jgi:hypothetical protein